MSEYLVTGCAGFIGARIAELLLESGATVVGVDNLNDAYDVRLKNWRLDRLRRQEGFRFQRLDICDRAALDRLFAETAPFDAVLNLAARAGVRQSVENPGLYVDTNVTGTLNLLLGCERRGIPKFVLASTSSLYGADNPRPFTEDANTDQPLSPYAASKKAAETLAFTYHYLSGIDVSVVRYFTVYGPAGRPDMSLFRFVQWVQEERPVLVYGDGNQQRDFTYVDDVARGTVAALEPLGYEIINIGSDEPVVLNDALHLVEDYTGRTARVEHAPAHAADVLATWANIDKAERLLGWRPQVDFRTGLRQLVDWYEEHRAWARDIVTR